MPKNLSDSNLLRSSSLLSFWMENNRSSGQKNSSQILKVIKATVPISMIYLRIWNSDISKYSLFGQSISYQPITELKQTIRDSHDCTRVSSRELGHFFPKIPWVISQRDITPLALFLSITNNTDLLKSNSFTRILHQVQSPRAFQNRRRRMPISEFLMAF